MIDEELYKLASLELNSDKRRPDLWARAVALASDDHDEARYLYTNLRVEEMLDERRNSNPQSAVAFDEPALEIVPDAGHSATGVPELETEEPASISGAPEIVFHSDEDNPPSEDIANPSTTRSSPMAAVFDADDTVLHVPSTPIPAEPVGAIEETLDQLAENDQTLKMDELTQALDSQQTLTGDMSNQSGTFGDDAADIFDETSNPQIDLDERANRDSAPTANTTDDRPHYDDPAKGRLYDIFEHYDGRMKAVKHGVSWPALFFTLPWLLYKKLWGTALIYLVLGAVSLFALLVTGLAIHDAGDGASPLLKLLGAGFALLAVVGLLFLPFRYGNNWVVNKLERKGFEFDTAVRATSPETALQRVLR